MYRLDSNLVCKTKQMQKNKQKGKAASTLSKEIECWPLMLMRKWRLKTEFPSLLTFHIYQILLFKLFSNSNCSAAEQFMLFCHFSNFEFDCSIIILWDGKERQLISSIDELNFVAARRQTLLISRGKWFEKKNQINFPIWK